MRIVFAGTPVVAVPSLQALASSGHHLVGAVTRPDRPAGRGKRLTESAVAEAASSLGLPVLKPAHPKDPDFLEQLQTWAPEAVAVIAYGALLPESALVIPAHGWINLHFSLLPAWRGAAPVQRAIWTGDEITGATTFRIVKELDAGPIYGVMTYALPPRATSGEVLTNLAESGAKLLVGTMDAIASGDARPLPQSTEGVSYAHKVTVDDARIDWSVPALAVDRQVRACTPAPGAWTTFRGQRLKLGPVVPAPDERIGPLPASAPTGSLIHLKHDLLVRAGRAWLRLGQVAPSGKSWMDATAWARGARIGSGADLERLGE
jgi:methionyl-tRNA formyltransferase